MLRYLKNLNVCSPKVVLRILQSVLLILCSIQLANAQFTANRLVVVQTSGSGSKNGSAVTLKEFTTSGVAGTSVSIPATGANALQIAASASGSEGFLTRSTDKNSILIAGYGTSGTFSDITGTSSAAVPRVIFKINAAGTASKVSSSTTYYDGNDIRAAISDGTNYWASGATSNDGINYFGPSAPARLGVGTNGAKGYGLRIFNGNIYYSCQKTNTFGIYQLGTGLPTSGSITPTLIFATGTATPQDFSFNAAGNVCYVAIDLNSSAGGIQKWTKSGSTWSLAYTFGTGVTNIGAFGLMADYSGNVPVIYATTNEVNTTGNRIIKIVDNGALAASTISTLVTGAANTWFHGITFTPCTSSTPTTISKTVCDTYTFNGSARTTSGTYIATLINKSGCDSVVTLNLAVNRSSSPTIINKTACDSYVFNNVERTESGTYIHIFTNKTGCDSSVTLNLTVNSSSSASVSKSACLSYIFNGIPRTTSGTYNATFTNKTGCDSVVTLALTITPVQWLGTTNTDWHTSTNWCGGVPTSTSDVIISGSTIPVISASAYVKNISIQNGSGLNISGINTLNVYGDWANNGSFTDGNGTVNFTGSTNTFIAGSTTTFYNLKIDKSVNACLTVNASVKLQEKLTFGTDATNTLAINNANGGSFTFLSDQNTTAHIDELSAPLPVLTGNFTCEKYLPAQSGRYSFMLGVPVSDASANSFQPTVFDGSGNPINGFLITGPFTGTNTGTGIVTYASSSFKYNPSTGLYSGYPVSGGDISRSPLTLGEGYRFSVRDNATSPGVVAKTLHASGSLATPGPFTFSNLVNGIGTKPFASGNITGIPSLSVGGWNLICNPYMSDISIDISNASNWTQSNMAYPTYTYNAATRDFAPCVFGVPFSNCRIGAFEAFWVQATGTPSLTINEQAKITTSNTSSLHRAAKDNLNYIGIKLSSSSSSNVNTTYIRYVDGSSIGNDQYDGLKLGATNRTYLSDIGVYTKAVDNIFYDVNAKPYYFTSDTTEMLVKLPPGNARLDFTDISNLEAGYSVSLYDRYTKTMSDVSTNPLYDFTAVTDSNSTGLRFQVIFNRTSVITNNTDVLNSGSSGITVYPSPADAGNITIRASGLGINANMTLYNATGRLVHTSILNTFAGNVNQVFNLNGILNSGIYTVIVNSDNRTFHQKILIK